MGKIIVKNQIFLSEETDGITRPFEARFLEPGLVKYKFGVCKLTKETIEKFIGNFIGRPVVIDHVKDIAPEDIKGKVLKVWFNPDDGWFWCSGVLTDKEAVKLIEQDGFNISCQYEITEYKNNLDGALYHGNPYDKEILNGVFDHLAIVKTPRYEDAFIAVNAYIAENEDNFEETDHPRDNAGRFTDGEFSTTSAIYNKEIDKIKSGEYPRSKKITVKDKPSNIWLKVGLQEAKIVLPAAVYLKATKEKHNVTEETMRNLPQLLEDPPFIFRSSTEPGSFVGVLDAIEKNKDEDKPLIVAVKPVNDRIEVNIITSTYGKDKDFIKREIKKGNLLYKRKKTASNSIVASIATETLNPPDNILIYNLQGFNPEVQNSLQKSYNKIINYITNWKGNKMTLEKRLFKGLFDALIAKNAEEEDKEKDKKAENDEVDKRDIIRQIMAIAGKFEDNEDVRTIAKLAEKLAYDKSEAGTADNEEEDKEKDKKAENDEDEKDKKIEELKAALKEAQNKCKNEEEDKEKAEKFEEFKKKVDEEAENKAKNSMDEAITKLYSALKRDQSTYMTLKEGVELGHKIWGK